MIIFEDMEKFCRFNKLLVICFIDASDKTNKLSVSNEQSYTLLTEPYFLLFLYLGGV